MTDADRLLALWAARDRRLALCRVPPSRQMAAMAYHGRCVEAARLGARDAAIELALDAFVRRWGL